MSQFFLTENLLNRPSWCRPTMQADCNGCLLIAHSHNQWPNVQVWNARGKTWNKITYLSISLNLPWWHRWWETKIWIGTRSRGSCPTDPLNIERLNLKWKKCWICCCNLFIWNAFYEIVSFSWTTNVAFKSIMGRQGDGTLQMPLMGLLTAILREGVIIHRCASINYTKHCNPTFPWLHNDDLPLLMARQEDNTAKPHTIHVELDQRVHVG